MKEVKIKFIPTGIIYTLPKEEALRVYRESRGNYEILEDDLVEEEVVEEKTSVYQTIVEEDEEEEKEAPELEALKKEADELGIKYAKNIGINKLKKKIEDYKAQ